VAIYKAVAAGIVGVDVVGIVWSEARTLPSVGVSCVLEARVVVH